MVSGGDNVAATNTMVLPATHAPTSRQRDRCATF
jgi:hypothetical protein